MRKTLAIFFAFAMLLAACSDDDTTATTTGLGSGPGNGISAVAANFDPSAISFAASLQLFDSCDAVLDHFKSEALAQVGPYGLNGGGGFYPMFGVAEGDTAREEAAPATTVVGSTATDGGSVSGVDYSGTNVQVEGVDEPDVIKTDGSHILAFNNQTLYYVDATAGSARLIGSLNLPGYDHRFFFDGDTAIVFARGDGYMIAYDDAARIAPPYAGPSTLVFEIDMSNPADMKVLRTMSIDGNYLSAREIDGTIRMVVSSFPNDLPFVYPSNSAAEDLALETNKRVIQNSTIETWLPSFTLVAGLDGEMIDSGLLVDCGQVHKPAEFAGFDTLSVVTMGLGDGLGDVTGGAVIAQGETVYATTDSLYVATNVWVPQNFWGTDEASGLEQDYSTALHKFDISGTGPARYVASGSVAGHLLNQFAMDEYMGNLRVATTDGPPWGSDDSSESYVTVLQVRDDQLQQVGRVGDMGNGERIYSVRFIGDAAYVVTFRQVDPFYVVDLSDPEAPKVAGELKINGYSGYLHPIGDHRILGIGRDADSEGRTTGAKATLFDVSDPTNPVAIGSWSMDDGYTDAEWDHLAFLYWAPREIAVLPVQAWQDQFYGAVVLKTDDGVREVGRISHSIDTGAATDCTILSDEKLLELDSGYVPEDGLIIQVCSDDEKGMTNMDCEWLPYEELAARAAEDGVDISTIMGEGDRLEVCWPGYYDQNPAITRSLVIGDTLWTLSWRSLQSNSLDDFTVTDQIVFG